VGQMVGRKWPGNCSRSSNWIPTRVTTCSGMAMASCYGARAGWYSGPWTNFAKMRRTHAVPLSTGARAVLDEARTWGGPLIFPGRGGRPLTDRGVARAGGLEPLATAHGFRSSFKVWAAEVARVADEVSEAALAHADKDKVRAAYLRTAFLDERRALMQAWADYLQARRRD
jgi:integrase